jgi:predicted phosphodiesterase
MILFNFEKKYLLFIYMILIITGCDSNKIVVESILEKGIKVAIIGDQGTTENSEKVLQMIKHEGAELLIINGDFDYKNNSKAWQKMNESILGKDFPIIAVAGNHDMASWAKYQEIIRKWQLNPKLNCGGHPGIDTTCLYKGIKIVSVTPGLFNDINHTAYIQDALKEDNSTWKICSWHKNMSDMQTGQKGDATGWGVYEICRQYGALITTGHEHAYARTYLLDNIENKIVTDFNSSSMKLSLGKTIVILSGLGGISSRPQLKNGYWWANTQNEDTGAVAGAFFCTFKIEQDPDKAQCYFKEISQGVLDLFTLEREK